MSQANEETLTVDPWAELLPPLEQHDAVAEANRCLYCYDAPCLHACPTHIDIPTFIRRIGTGDAIGAARIILDENLLGATCARVCPVEELCEGACVLNAHDQPIKIGRLQRYATDSATERLPLHETAPPTGFRILVIGSGPAGLSASGELAKLGHEVTVWERKRLPGGLSTHGIVTLREPVSVALGEVEMVEAMGVRVETSRELKSAQELAQLRTEYDAVLLATGLGTVPDLRIPGSELVIDGLAYIEQAKLASEQLPAYQKVVVVGAGNTAIDAATIARRTGAEVTIAYRRGPEQMPAYQHEYEFALREGIEFRFFARPWQISAVDQTVTGLVVIPTKLTTPGPDGRTAVVDTDQEPTLLECDAVIAAIGQESYGEVSGWSLALNRGYIDVDNQLCTSLPKVWAAGDAVRATGDASTVMAVQDGKLAAASIHTALSNSRRSNDG